MQAMPTKRTDNLITQPAGAELLVYDETRHKAFCLNRTSSAVWRLCDGAQSVEQIAAAATLELAAPVSEELVLFALEELCRNGLVETAGSSPAVSRREMVQKMGVGAAMMLPVIAAIVAPKAAQAYNGCFDCE